MSIVLSVATVLAAAELQPKPVEFTSHVDGKPDHFAMQAPKVKPTGCLLVYFHGMATDYNEPFQYPTDWPVAEAIGQYYPNAALLSVSCGRSPSWGVDTALQDVTDNIRAARHECGESLPIILLGCSMGAHSALLYAAKSPADIRTRIAGVVVAQPTSDLAKLYRTSAQAQVAPAIAKALNGTPEQVPDLYRLMSLKANANRIPQKCKVVVISTKKDNVISWDIQNEAAEELRAAGLNVDTIALPGLHGSQSATDWMDGIDHIRGKSREDTQGSAPHASSAK